MEIKPSSTYAAFLREVVASARKHQIRHFEISCTPEFDHPDWGQCYQALKASWSCGRHGASGKIDISFTASSNITETEKAEDQ